MVCGTAPSWNYVIWGGIHGFFLVIERSGFDRVLQHMWRPFRHIYMFLVLMFAFVFFRTETIPEALSYFSVMFGLESGEAPIHVTLNLFARDKQIIFAAAIVGMLPCRSIVSAWWEKARPHIPESISAGLSCRTWMAISAHTLYLFVLMGVFTLSFMHVAAGTYNPFIYFRF